MNRPDELQRRAWPAAAAAALAGASFLHWTPAPGAVMARDGDIPGASVWAGPAPLTIVVVASLVALVTGALGALRTSR